MRNIFEIKNVNFSVDGIEKVKNVSFSIENEGDIICLLGPSGIGKTTILRTIAGLEKINKGEIILKGQLISSKDNHVEPENRNISLAFQDNCLFPHYTVEKNIQIAVNRNRNKTKKIIPVITENSQFLFKNNNRKRTQNNQFKEALHNSR